MLIGLHSSEQQRETSLLAHRQHFVWTDKNAQLLPKLSTTTRQLAILKIKTQVLFNYGVNFGKLSASEEAEVENTFSINHMLGKVQVLISVSHREL